MISSAPRLGFEQYIISRPLTLPLTQNEVVHVHRSQPQDVFIECLRMRSGETRWAMVSTIDKIGLPSITASAARVVG